MFFPASPLAALELGLVETADVEDEGRRTGLIDLELDADFSCVLQPVVESAAVRKKNCLGAVVCSAQPGVVAHLALIDPNFDRALVVGTAQHLSSLDGDECVES